MQKPGDKGERRLCQAEGNLCEARRESSAGVLGASSVWRKVGRRWAGHGHRAGGWCCEGSLRSLVLLEEGRYSCRVRFFFTCNKE